MNNATPRSTVAPPHPPTAPRLLARRPGSARSGHLSWGDVFDERAPIIGAPAFFGPPVIFVLGPWLLLVLLLIGPFVLAMMAVLALAAGAALVAASAAVIASPYLLLRHLRTRAIAPAKSYAFRHLFRKHRVSSGRLGSPQPKGTS